MPAPSQLAIATSSLQRLAKEVASYHKELQMQQKSIDRLEKSQVEETDEDRGNHAFQLKQEVRGPEDWIPAHLVDLFSIPLYVRR
jgi:tubulin-specific chaperone A